MVALGASAAANHPDRAHGLRAVVAQPVRCRGGKRDRVSRREDELVESHDHSKLPAEDEAEFVPAVTHERVIGAGRSAGLIDRLEKLDVLVGPEPHPLPFHSCS